jgi:hypothetical protein
MRKGITMATVGALLGAAAALSFTFFTGNDSQVLAEVPSVSSSPQVDIGDVQSRVPFKVKELNWLPFEAAKSWAHVSTIGTSPSAEIFYTGDGQWVTLSQTEVKSTQVSGRHEITEVPLHDGLVGQLLNNGRAHILTWQVNSVTYKLACVGKKCTKADLIRMAASL